MRKAERNEQIKEIADQIYGAFMDLVHYRFQLEELGCKREAKALDKACGVLENLSNRLVDKSRKA